MPTKKSTQCLPHPELERRNSLTSDRVEWVCTACQDVVGSIPMRVFASVPRESWPAVEAEFIKRMVQQGSALLRKPDDDALGDGPRTRPTYGIQYAGK